MDQRQVDRPRDLKLTKVGTQTVLEWISLYKNGLSTTKIAKHYGVCNSTVGCNLGRYVKLRSVSCFSNCIRLYHSNSRAHAALHITIDKPELLVQLSRIVGGNLYEVQRAWRLVIYGKAAGGLLHGLDIRHQEKVNKAKLVMNHAGEKWPTVEPLWLTLVSRIKGQVNQYKAQARLEYIEKHGIPHRAETRIAEVAL